MEMITVHNIILTKDMGGREGFGNLTIVSCWMGKLKSLKKYTHKQIMVITGLVNNTIWPLKGIDWAYSINDYGPITQAWDDGECHKTHKYFTQLGNMVKYGTNKW